MPEEQDPSTDASGVSSPPDASAASSAGSQQASGAPASQPSAAPPTPPEQKPWNLPPEERWNELQRELYEVRRAYQELAARAVHAPAPTPPPAQPVDPWEPLIHHQDPATAQFYQQQKRLVDHAVAQGREQAYRELAPVLETIQRSTAAISLKEFRKENPDILPGSEEEALVIAYMEGRVDGIRHPIESARNNVVVRRLEDRAHAAQGQRALMPQKRQAASVESATGIPATAGLPPKPTTWQETAGSVLDKGGGMLDVAQAIFGRRRTPVQP